MAAPNNNYVILNVVNSVTFVYPVKIYELRLSTLSLD